MALTGLEQLLIGTGLTLGTSAITGSVVLVLTAKDRVKVKDCAEFRTGIEETHRLNCPENRRVMSVDDHDRVCLPRIEPIQRDIAETKQAILKLHEKIDRILIQTATKK